VWAFNKLLAALKKNYSDRAYASVEHELIPPERFPTRELLQQVGLPVPRGYEGTCTDPELAEMFAANYAAGDTEVTTRRYLIGSALAEDRSCFWEHATRFMLPGQSFGLFEMQQLTQVEMHRIALAMRQGLDLLGLSASQVEYAQFMQEGASILGADFEYSKDTLVDRSPAYWAFVFLCSTAGYQNAENDKMRGGENELFLDPRNLQINSVLQLTQFIDTGAHLSFFVTVLLQTGRCQVAIPHAWSIR
jgi:hypothetical protein